MVQRITAAQLRDLLDGDRDVSILDTRPADSFTAWHIQNAIHYPYNADSTFDPDAFRRHTGLTPDSEIVTICAKGISSFDIAKRLEDEGFGPVTVVENGMEGWSAVYDVVEIPTSSELEVLQFQRRAKGCLSYLIIDPSAAEAAVVDPTRHVDRFAAAAADRGCSIESVFDTHVHADHLSGGRELAEYVGAPYYLGADAADRGVTFDFQPLEPNEVVPIGEYDIKAVATPGHTSEIMSYLIGREAMLTGDTLFVDSVGRTELQFGEGDATTGAKLLYQSLHRTVLAEPDTITVLPGHFAIASDGTTGVTPGDPIVSTIGDLRTGLDLLTIDRASFVTTITDSLPDKPPNYDTIIAINAGQDRVQDEDTRTELELGPNNCAATAD